MRILATSMIALALLSAGCTRKKAAPETAGTTAGQTGADGTDGADGTTGVGADGTAKAEMFSTLVSMKGGAGRLALADADGSAIVVHANADDYKTQPIGGAGDRIGCAVIK